MLTIQGRTIGGGSRPFIVAELSGNHNQSLDRAIALVQAAAQCGCDAVKLQTYTPDTLTIDCSETHFLINNPSSPWHGRKLYDLYQEAYTPWEWHKPIFEKCRELGLIAFSTPFDTKAIALLEELGSPAYKVASFENVHLPLIKDIAATGKPIILSTGMASLAELCEAVSTIRNTGNNKIILLKCTSTYPSLPANSNIRTIEHMRELFGVEAGLSDHTLGIGVAVASVAFGACMIEKHLTLRRADGGPDSSFSLEPIEMRALVEEVRNAHLALGGVSYEMIEAEKASAVFRRSIFAVEDIKAGEEMNSTNVRIIRPGFGLAPKFIDLVIGRRAKSHIRRGTPISWDQLK